MNLVTYNPTAGPVAEKAVMAQRVDTLQDGVLGVIDNGKHNSDRVLNQVVEGIKSRYRLKDVITIRKDKASYPIKDDMAQELAGGCDSEVAGIGD